MATETTQAAEKVLKVLNTLLRNFAVGFTNRELAEATGLNPSDITRYVKTLEKCGFAERVPETERIRVSHRMARHAVTILHSLDAAKGRIDESITRITTPL